VSSLRIDNATIVTMNDHFDVVVGSVSVRDGRIVRVGAFEQEPHDRVIDAAGGILLPGFVQTHVHLCQTLFRGLADDLPLMDWLRRRVWPLEAAHTASSLRSSAETAAAELLLSGTTAVLTMETVHDTDAVCEALVGTGIRATVGKCMMDGDSEAPPRLREDTRRAIDDSLALRARWHGAASGRLRVAFAPRFAVSCTRDLLEGVAALSDRDDVLVHTHASESLSEIAIVRERSGMRNLEYLAATGLASPRLCVAHCVWVDEDEQALMAERAVKVLHCPSSNLKLGSGLAPVVELLARHVSVSIGADGAACNNRLDMFDEMRLAAGLQAVRKGPGALPARAVLWMATREGASALGLGADIGSIEVGKRADLVLLEAERPHFSSGLDPYSLVVYAARGADVRTTIVDGRILVDEHRLIEMDAKELWQRARIEASALVARANLD
jgi:5-methylthioadenosine/S-adenosylhomocysteine deaminase